MSWRLYVVMLEEMHIPISSVNFNFIVRMLVSISFYFTPSNNKLIYSHASILAEALFWINHFTEIKKANHQSGCTLPPNNCINQHIIAKSSEEGPG